MRWFNLQQHFLFALLAGAVADVFSKRKLIIFVQSLMAIVTVILACIVYWQVVTPTVLLIFTFLLGVGAAFTAPAKQAINPILVPEKDLPSAIALNSVGFNISRSIGPAIAGILIVTVGINSPFLYNALSFLILIGAFLWWCPGTAKEDLPKEPIPNAIRTGLRYARYSSPLKATLGKAAVFFISASAFWALLPLFVKTELEGDANVFGVLVGGIGVGAVIGASQLPRLKKIMTSSHLVTAATWGVMGVFTCSAFLQIEVLAILGCVIFGICWIWALSSFNISAQLALPDWVRARGLSIYLMVFFGSMSLGSLIWGSLATYFGICTTLFVAAVIMGIGAYYTRHLALNQGEAVDLKPYMHWPEPVVEISSKCEKELLNERSPVMITIEYRIDKADEAVFLQLMCRLGQARKQYGAYNWDILEEAEDPGTFIEYFMDVSWLEYLRHHKRVSGQDRELQKTIYALHRGDSPPKVRRFFGSPAIHCND